MSGVFLIRGASGFSGCFFIGLCPAHALLGRLSQAIKRIQVSVAVKSATKCTLKCVRCALHTLSRTLNRFLNRHPYPVTLNRSTYTIPTCLRPERDSSIENPPLIPEAPFLGPSGISGVFFIGQYARVPETAAPTKRFDKA